ncbi:tripartite tricarboxylate transporter TctB family protein [Algihabitans albus]|uniref:tripartite tricarboxylate transporter TctB family protein n=1 Tax=Algihabitans albus TaxID=2164067 RepID=UPI000E5D0EED|nr:tripartite tricarboxylate transporter TctB family protein [Algihabitans albus]
MSNRIRLQNDLWIGALLCGFGLWAAWEAQGFDARSGTYPTILGGLLAASGACVAVMGLLKSKRDLPMAGALRAALPAAAVIAAWAAALGFGLGFLLPTLLMQIALLWLGGVRGALRIPIYALLITGVAYGLFGLALDVPLPQSRIPGLL